VDIGFVLPHLGNQRSHGLVIGQSGCSRLFCALSSFTSLRAFTNSVASFLRVLRWRSVNACETVLGPSPKPDRLMSFKILRVASGDKPPPLGARKPFSSSHFAISALLRWPASRAFLMT
jgi:hypothetical protein